MTVKPIPEGYQQVVPYLLVEDVSRLRDFLQAAFNATVHEQTPGEDGAIKHADVIIGDSHVMMGQARAPEYPAMPCMLYLYVEDTDATYRQALAAGATSVQEPQNMFYGDRNAGVKDAFGNQWWIGTHVEDVSPEEMARRASNPESPKALDS